MKKRSVVLLLFIATLGLVCGRKSKSAGEVPHCAYGITVKDLLKLAGIYGPNLLSYLTKLRAHNVDQSVLPSLTLQQLNDIGISALGDRVKIYNFFSKDPDQCSSSSCQNDGICRDGFRCFSCVCNPKAGYYGQSCELKCPCHNGGLCKTIPTGFKCICPPGYSGDLCKIRYLTEEKIVKLEEMVRQLTTRLGQAEQKLEDQKVEIKDLQERPVGSWRLQRANEILNQLEKIQLHQSTPTYTQKLPIVLPQHTRAILISIYCSFWNRNGHAYLNYITYQKGNDNAAAKAEGYNTHYNVYANTFLYEQMIPWNTTLPNELVFRVTDSYRTGGNDNWYRVRLVGFITSQ